MTPHGWTGHGPVLLMSPDLKHERLVALIEIQNASSTWNWSMWPGQRMYHGGITSSEWHPWEAELSKRLHYFFERLPCQFSDSWERLFTAVILVDH